MAETTGGGLAPNGMASVSGAHPDDQPLSRDAKPVVQPTTEESIVDSSL